MSLLELLVALAISGILAAIAVPAYSQFITRARQADIRLTLLNLQHLQERHRLENESYASAAELGSPVTEYYTISVENTGRSTYTLIAKRIDEKRDGCDQISVDQSSHQTPEECWH
ncbi:prepilin-type N-terminal cleavage/methylation domain-containing protein [Alteromonas pelagimontana]|uniref:Prepilin-type N-terminal cleavage/methylation domain-containing protein n=2 Tax=Alteromonas pelagimontana TaxID=1858656 RepID=A0A6N3IVM4_9ALTE|nr:type IV pilin protein [Alteromonas pelagimontana]QJR82906.1 prepilin-type N-terminal cleavage/methylation domain-containing protein [Alteromonas pelagimontana]